ncbi:MAG: SPOR domain-containing protein [Pseudohongiellaceae bacterium]
MAQDFGKQSSPQKIRRKPERTTPKGAFLPKQDFWSWFFSGLFVGVILSIITYLGLLMVEKKNIEQAAIATVSEDVSEPPNFALTFYDNLANAEIDVNVPTQTSLQPETARSNVTQSIPESSTTKTVNYLLQVGSFQNRVDAENRRAEIMLEGMDVAIMPGVVSGRNLFRVQAGPFVGRQDAEVARDILSAKNIDSIVLQIR